MRPSQIVDNTERPTSFTRLDRHCCRRSQQSLQFHRLTLLLLLRTFVERKIRINTPNALSQQLNRNVFSLALKTSSEMPHGQVSSLSGTDRDCRPIAHESKLRWQMQHRRRGTWLQWRLIVETGFWRYALRAVVYVNYGSMMKPCMRVAV